MNIHLIWSNDVNWCQQVRGIDIIYFIDPSIGQKAIITAINGKKLGLKTDQ